MGMLLLIEWMKYRKSRLIYALLVIFGLVVYSLSSGVLGTSINIGVIRDYLSALSRFPDLWFTVAVFSNYLLFFIMGFWAVNIISGEYRQRTFRQAIIMGLSRSNYFFMKLLHLFSAALVFTFIYALVSLVLALQFESNISSAFSSGGIYLLKHFLLAMIYGLGAAIFALWIRKSGLSFIAFLGYFILERLIVWFLGSYVSSIFADFHFWPRKICNQLAPDFIMRFGEQLGQSGLTGSVLPDIQVLIAGLTLLVLLMCVLYLSIMRKDI